MAVWTHRRVFEQEGPRIRRLCRKLYKAVTCRKEGQGRGCHAAPVTRTSKAQAPSRGTAQFCGPLAGISVLSARLRCMLEGVVKRASLACTMPNCKREHFNTGTLIGRRAAWSLTRTSRIPSIFNTLFTLFLGKSQSIARQTDICTAMVQAIIIHEMNRCSSFEVLQNSEGKRLVQ